MLPCLHHILEVLFPGSNLREGFWPSDIPLHRALCIILSIDNIVASLSRLTDKGYCVCGRRRHSCRCCYLFPFALMCATTVYQMMYSDTGPKLLNRGLNHFTSDEIRFNFKPVCMNINTWKHARSQHLPAIPTCNRSQAIDQSKAQFDLFIGSTIEHHDTLTLDPNSELPRIGEIQASPRHDYHHIPA